MNTAVGAAYLMVGFVGLFIQESILNILALNSPDNVLHFASAALLLITGLGHRPETPVTVNRVR